MQNILGLTHKELEDMLVSLGYKKFHAQQIFSWVYKKRAKDFLKMSDLSLDLRECLKKNFCLSRLKLIKTLKSKDATSKFLFALEDKDFIEAVIIPANKRVTGCISTQVGCKFRCHFCASGLLGFKRNLTSAEMIEEILYLKDHSHNKITHIVFMGTGEPLDNYDQVIKAVRIINSSLGLSIGARRITVSSCGIIPGIKKLSDENLQIELSISLHSADEKTRSMLMPVNNKYPLKELIPACRDYIKKTNRQITFEYVLIRGLNSSLPDAQKLATMLVGLRLFKVNLIPANPIEGLDIEPPKNKEILLFRDYLLKHGVNVTLRKPRGKDIEAACGQLRLRYEEK